MTKYRSKQGVVEAVQLLWTTWSEMCELLKGTEGGPDGGPTRLVGCYVDVNGREIDDTNGRIGLKIEDTSRVVAVEGDWVSKGDTGLRFHPANTFTNEYARMDDYKVDFEPDWQKYPKLASVFVARPRENVYWEELHALLSEARSDAASYVHDVRVDELQKARADERERMGINTATKKQTKVIDVEEERRQISPISNVLVKYDALVGLWPANTIDISVKRPSSDSQWLIRSHPKSGEELHAALMKLHGAHEVTEYELTFYDCNTKVTRGRGRIELPRTLASSFSVGSVFGLSEAQLVQALRNVGVYLDECDACAEVFFTGSKMHDHTCPKGR